MLDAYNTYLVNMERVRNFVSLYEIITKNAGRGRKSIQTTDILRAGVVFLHSTLEEYLRTIIMSKKIPKLFENKDTFCSVLANVNLVGENTGRSNVKKFGLSDLWDAKDQTVLDLITDSLEDKVNQMTFNDYSQIVASLREVGIQLTTNHNINDLINNYIHRRHKIVHEADKNLEHGKGKYISVSIESRVLLSWISAVDGLVSDIESQLHDGSETV